MLLQDNGGGGSMPPLTMEYLIIIAIIITIACVSGIFLLKLGLKIVKANKRTKLKTVAFYYIFLLGTILTIMSQMFFIRFGGNFSVMAIGLGVLSIFIVTNMINIIFELGIKKAIIVAAMITIPIAISMFLLMPLLGSLQAGPGGSNGSGTSILLLQCFF